MAVGELLLQRGAGGNGIGHLLIGGHHRLVILRQRRLMARFGAVIAALDLAAPKQRQGDGGAGIAKHRIAGHQIGQP